MGCFLGIDVGTSGTKTIVCTETGQILASVTEEYPIYQPKPNWSEQNPADWWDAAKITVKAVIEKSGVKGSDISGIGLSGQMHGAVLLDKSHNVLRPAILWNDQRTGAECDEITATIGAERLIDLTCNPALTGFTAPKILWVRKNEPDVYEKTVKVLLPKDYIRFRLTGAFATEVSDASGTLLFDVKNRRWSGEVIEALQLDASLMPDCYESAEVSGEVLAEIASELGIPKGTPVVGGGGDQAAIAVGNGIVKTGVISATLGTSGVVFAFCDDVQTDPQGRVHTFCHAVPGKWHVMGVMLSAGGSFQWFRNNLGEPEKTIAKKEGVDPYDVLCREAEKAGPGSEGLFFLPYLTGERTPHANPNAKGGWIGLTARHQKAHMIRSTLEGITYGMRDSLEIMKGMGVPVNEIRVSGGGAASAFWRQLQADIYGQDVVTINASEGGALGVALLAAVGTGTFNSVEEACDAVIEITTKTARNATTAAVYDKYYPLYGTLYQHLKNDFDVIQQLIG
jgi:xylulokinase